MNQQATGFKEILIVVVAMIAGAVFIFVAFELGMAARPKEMLVWGSTEAAALSSSSSTPSQPIAAPAGAADGKAVYDRNCNACHPGGGKGLGPALNTADFKQRYAQDPALSDVIRKGKGGAMPSFSVAQISDADLKALVSYIKGLP